MMKWGLSLTEAKCEHSCLAKQRYRILEADLLWLPGVPGSHSEQMIQALCCTEQTQITLMSENSMYISQQREAEGPPRIRTDVFVL